MYNDTLLDDVLDLVDVLSREEMEDLLDLDNAMDYIRGFMIGKGYGADASVPEMVRYYAGHLVSVIEDELDLNGGDDD